MARQDWDMSIQPTAASEILGNADVVSRMMEYIEKKSEDFAAEVAAQIAASKA